MPREPKPQWHKGNRCWYARIGGPGPKGRARPVYFSRPLGSGVNPPKGERDEAGAWTYFNALRAQYEARWVDTADPVLKQMSELYLAWCETRVSERSMSVGHLRTLQTRLGKFAEHDAGAGPFGARRARSLSVDDLDLWVKSLKKIHRPHYVKNCVRAVQAVYSWAARDVAGREPRRLLSRNPIEGFRAPGVARMPERFAERGEAAEFLRFLRARAAKSSGDARRFERGLILLERVLIGTGCRPGEACQMRWEQVRWDGGTNSAGHRFARVVLEEHKTDETTEKPRVIYLSPILTRAIRRAAGKSQRHPVYLFTHLRGTRSRNETPEAWGDPWDSVALAAKIRRVRRAAIAAGAKFKDEGANRLVNYRWRHTAISTLLMMQVDVPTVAELTGTSPAMIYHTYGHILSGHLAAAAEKLAMGRRPAND